MTTALERPLARTLVISGEPYKLVLSPKGLRLTRKGRQKGVEVSWDAVLALGDASDAANEPVPPTAAQRTDLPQAISADLAREVRTATEALTRARETLQRGSSLPASVLSDIPPDPVYGRPEHRSDWFIEPLLTPAEVASILRVSRNTVARLPIRCILLSGQRRYRQSELRRYLMAQEIRS